MEILGFAQSHMQQVNQQGPFSWGAPGKLSMLKPSKWLRLLGLLFG